MSAKDLDKSVERERKLADKQMQRIIDLAWLAGFRHAVETKDDWNKPEEETEWKVGDGLRVLDSSGIENGEELEVGDIYDVVAVDNEGLPNIHTSETFFFEFTPEEMKYVERVHDDEETEVNGNAPS